MFTAQKKMTVNEPVLTSDSLCLKNCYSGGLTDSIDVNFDLSDVLRANTQKVRAFQCELIRKALIVS